MTYDRAPAPPPGAASVPDNPRADTWLERFCRRLAAPEARHFAAWAAHSAGPRIVLERQQFEPVDLKPWLGAVSILQWDADLADYRYRLFGTKWTAWLGRDLTGQTPIAWLDDTAEEIRLRLDGVANRHTPVGGRLVVPEHVDGWAKRKLVPYEQVLWPLSYGPRAAPAVIVLAVSVSDDAGPSTRPVHADVLPAGDWFSAELPQHHGKLSPLAKHGGNLKGSSANK